MMPGETLRIGPAPAMARATCVFLHGRGQSPQDFAMLAEGLGAQGVLMALPAAPGGSWYDARAVDGLTGHTEAQLAAAMDAVDGVVVGLRAEAAGRPLVLAGFSQGACVALEAAFRGGERPDGLVVLTGCRVGRSGDARPLSTLHGMPVILTGADADPWIPVAAFAEAVADLGRAGARMRAEIYPGRPHEVSRAEAALLAGMLSDLSALRTLPEGATP